MQGQQHGKTVAHIAPGKTPLMGRSTQAVELERHLFLRSLRANMKPGALGAARARVHTEVTAAEKRARIEGRAIATVYREDRALHANAGLLKMLEPKARQRERERIIALVNRPTTAKGAALKTGVAATARVQMAEVDGETFLIADTPLGPDRLTRFKIARATEGTPPSAPQQVRPKVNRHKLQTALMDRLDRLVLDGLTDPPTRAAICLTMTHKERAPPDEVAESGPELVRQFEARGDTIFIKAEPEKGGRVTWPGWVYTAASIPEIREIMAAASGGDVKLQWARFMEWQPTVQLRKWMVKPPKDAAMASEPVCKKPPRPYSAKRFERSRRKWTKYALKDTRFPIEQSILASSDLVGVCKQAGCELAGEGLTKLMEELYAEPESVQAREVAKRKRKEEVAKRYGRKAAPETDTNKRAKPQPVSAKPGQQKRDEKKSGTKQLGFADLVRDEEV